jgi:hypothetical protein
MGIMAADQIHLIVTPQQARSIAAALVLTKQILAIAPGVPVYPNLGDFGLERDLATAEVNAAQETVIEQMKRQMPKE